MRLAGFATVGINPTDAQASPEDDEAGMTREAAAAGYAFPYLRDESQEVARAFRAACTPDFYVLGPDRRLAYRGQFDGSRPNSGVPVTGTDLRGAVDALLAGQGVGRGQILILARLSTRADSRSHRGASTPLYLKEDDPARIKI